MRRTTASLIACALAFPALTTHAQQIQGEISSVEECARYIEQAQSDDTPNDRRLYAVRLTEDEYILTQLNQAFRDSQEFDSNSLTANVDDGVVTLGGLVSDRANRERVVALASEIPGVQSVNADLLWVSGATQSSPAAEQVAESPETPEESAPNQPTDTEVGVAPEE